MGHFVYVLFGHHLKLLRFRCSQGWFSIGCPRKAITARDHISDHPSPLRYVPLPCPFAVACQPKLPHTWAGLVSRNSVANKLPAGHNASGKRQAAGDVFANGIWLPVKGYINWNRRPPSCPTLGSACENPTLCASVLVSGFADWTPPATKRGVGGGMCGKWQVAWKAHEICHAGIGDVSPLSAASLVQFLGLLRLQLAFRPEGCFAWLFLFPLMPFQRVFSFCHEMCEA